MEFIDLKAQQRRLGDRVAKAIQRVLDHGQYILGPEVWELEQQLARFGGARHAITCASGTDALLMALMARGTGPGDMPFLFRRSLLSQPRRRLHCWAPHRSS